MLLGIGLIGSVTSTVTAFFLVETKEAEKNDIKDELSEIKQEIKTTTRRNTKESEIVWSNNATNLLPVI